MKYSIVNILLLSVCAVSSSHGRSLRGYKRPYVIQSVEKFVRKVQENATEVNHTATDEINATATNGTESVEENNVTTRVQDAVNDVVDTEALEETVMNVVENIDREEIKSSTIGDVVEGAGEAAEQITDNIDKELVSEVVNAVNQTLTEMTKEELANKTLEALEDEDVQEALVDVVDSANEVVEAFEDVIESVDKDEVTNVIAQNIEGNLNEIDAAVEQVIETVDFDGAADVIDSAISEVVENEVVVGVIEKAAENEMVAGAVEKFDETATEAVNTIEEKVTETAGSLGFDAEGIERQNICGERCTQECAPPPDTTPSLRVILGCNRTCMRECMDSFFTEAPTSPPVTASASPP